MCVEWQQENLCGRKKHSKRMERRKENAMYTAAPGKQELALRGDLAPESWADGANGKKTQREKQCE
jgi:hypothetical protein